MFKKFFAGLVLALASVGSASAEFIIDSFNASQPNGHVSSRTVNASGGSVVELGTALQITTANNFSIDYVFSGSLGSIDAGVLGLRLDVLAFGDFTASARWYLGNFSTLVSTQTFSALAANSTSFTSGTAPLNADRLRIQFSNQTGNAETISLDRLTATPEPTSMLMLGSCLGAGWYARRRMFKGKKATKA